MTRIKNITLLCFVFSAFCMLDNFACCCDNEPDWTRYRSLSDDASKKVKLNWIYKSETSFADRQRSAWNVQIHGHVPCVFEVHDDTQPNFCRPHNEFEKETANPGITYRSCSIVNWYKFRARVRGVGNVEFFVQGNKNLKWSAEFNGDATALDMTLGQLYNRYADEDGWLYISYAVL